MKIATYIAAAVATLAPFGAAQSFRVVNGCKFPIWLQSFNQNNTAYGKLTEIPINGPIYSEKLGTGSITVKLANNSNVQKNPLFVGYTNTPGATNLAYQFNAHYGNPFIQYENTLGGSHTGCNYYQCTPGDTGCYEYTSRRIAITALCARPAVITATICDIVTS